MSQRVGVVTCVTHGHSWTNQVQVRRSDLEATVVSKPHGRCNVAV